MTKIGLFQDIFFNLHFLFRPQRDAERRWNDNDGSFDENASRLGNYIDAENHGKYNGECFRRYGMCPFSIRSILPKVSSIK